jgi:hypothetical protein
MIYLQGVARSKSPANACFELVRNGIIELFLSRETLTEPLKIVAPDEFLQIIEEQDSALNP